MSEAATAKPTCSHCGSKLKRQEAGSNAVFDWTLETFWCGSWRQAYSETGRTAFEGRSEKCETRQPSEPQWRWRRGGRIDRSAAIAAMDAVINGTSPHSANGE